MNSNKTNLFKLLKNFLILLFPIFLGLQTSAKHFSIAKNIDYVTSASPEFDTRNHKLDIYAPNKEFSTGKVLVFIHGGSWETGHKETYRSLGRAFANNGIIAVIINYRLSPQVPYEAMAYDCARAVAWVKEHITEYGGNAQKIFIAGHSAGGHLAALITEDATYFEKAGTTNPIKGVILNDAFGLNIFKYLDHGYKGDSGFRKVFTNEPAAWKKGSPILYVKKDVVKYYILVGGKTYPIIKSDSYDFHAAKIKMGNSSEIHTIKRKRHIGMILMFFGKRNEQLQLAVDFIKNS